MNCKSTDILIVEDNPNDALLTIRSLKENNLANNIVHVRDGQEALDYLFAEGIYRDRDPLNLPKAILLDLKLPKLDGLQVLARIRGDERMKCIPVVILTSSQENGDLSRCYQLGANSYIVKPVDFESFSEAIKQLGLYWLLLNKLPVQTSNL
jgi:two-component system response regulator